MIARTTRNPSVWLSLPLLVALALLLASVGPAGAAEFTATAGIDGRGRVGMWAECRIETGQEGAAESVVVSSTDGDGVGVNYTQPVASEGGLRCYFQLGRSQDRLQVSLTDTSGSSTTTPIDAPTPIPFEKEWILAIGDAIGIQSASDQQGRRHFPVVSLIADSQPLPHHWIAYNGVDLIVLPGSHAAIVNTLEDSQKQALADWVRRGGRMLLTLGGQSKGAVAPGSWIRESLGLEIDEEVVDIDPRAIESFTTTQTPLKAFTGLRLPTSGGRTLLTGRTLDRQTVPIAKEYLVGFGRVLVLAADLDQEPFASWTDRQSLLERLLPNTLSIRPNNNSQRHTRDAGYTDLVGQIRRTIDQFDSHWVLPFKWLAGFFVLYLGLIGPLDYWIVNRWFGRPLLGWITFPMAVIVFAGLAFYGTTIATPPQPVVNQFSIVDIDPSSNLGRGFAWTQYLSGTAGRNDLHYSIDAGFANSDSQQPILGWWGVNGQEFGGLSAIGRDRQMPEYAIDGRVNSDASLSTVAIGLPLATAATKGLAAWWQFEPNRAADSSLKKRPGTDLLSGSVSNPLDVDLMDGVLVYRGWAYLLPTRFTAGKRIAQVSTLTSKNLKWRLTRRSVDKASTATEPWNPEMQGDMDRILEIAMFHDTAGGPKYTELSNRIINHLDLSHVLATDHAILMGRVDEPVIQLAGEQQTAKNGTVLSFARILLPVDSGR
ncbi:hypothetical protein EC9_12950 [Rosistilla ulvae]|uniref:DUF4350 domain-containing protein n=1 Tax=Rosistilla ulvae TaxID=1930277 RepID=A0A517LWX7_9BACT|nr:hypothetical protein [Rosistilla ulvae]QDS87119.1 hypothetical protein EC9_12950 [Rosistilla ulvae]